MQKIIIAISLLFVLIVGYLWKGEPDVKKNTIKTTTHIKHVETEETRKTIIEEQIEHNNPNSDFKLEDTGVETNISVIESTTVSVFSEIYIDDAKLIIQPREAIEPISAIHMNKDMIKDRKVGDTIVLPTIDGNSYEIIVTNRKVSKNGNVSIDGNYTENGITYHSVLTEGEISSFISLTTPTGNYEIELENGLGYMYSTADMENTYIDYSKSDIAEPIE